MFPAAFRARLGPATPPPPPRSAHPEQASWPRPCSHHGDTITVTLSRRVYSPVLRQSDLRTDTTISWWQNCRLRFQLSKPGARLLHGNPREVAADPLAPVSAQQPAVLTPGRVAALLGEMSGARVTSTGEGERPVNLSGARI